MTRNSVLIIGGTIIVVLFAVMQFNLIIDRDNGEGPSALSSSGDQAALEKIPLHSKPRPVNPISFVNEEGETLDISAWRGKVVLLNIWATWCVPCREEMPTLDRLQKQIGGKYFEVAALSIDQGGVEKVRKFYNQINIDQLKIYVDQSMSATTRLGAFGIPATLLLSPDGLELGRFVGPTTWDTPEMISFLESIITQQFEER
ncbi:MAG: TlpA disulfide reductase family protein [Sneathiella sp.]